MKLRLGLQVAFLFMALSLCLPGSASLVGESAYTRLRAQFLKARKAEFVDFQVGQPWYCSSGLEAAKGQLRHVPLWEHRYLWAPGENAATLQNLHELLSMTLDLDLATGEYLDLFRQPAFESFKATEEGHLLVEVAVPTLGLRKSQLERSFFNESWYATQYYLCMNPEWQSNDDWEYDREQMFGVKGRS